MSNISPRRRRYLRDCCDAAWYAREHAKWQRCARCGEAPVEIHRLIRKGSALSSDPMTPGIGLCAAHHRGSEFSAHGTPAAFEKWLRAKYPRLWEFWVENRNRVVQGTDYEARLAILRKEVRCE